MIDHTLVFGIVAVIGLLIVGGVLYAIPVTRPYARKFWWILAIAILFAIGLIVLRKRPGNWTTLQKYKDDAEGDHILRDSMGGFDELIDHAKEKSVLADAELAATRMKAEKDRTVYVAKLDVVKEIDDSIVRRKALIRLVEGA